MTKDFFKIKYIIKNTNGKKMLSNDLSNRIKEINTHLKLCVN